jgi:type I restriction enzyme S subunit
VLIEKSGGGESQPVGFAVVFTLKADAVCSNFVALLRPNPGVDSAFAGLVLAAAYRAGCNVPFVKQTTGIQNLDLPGYLAQGWHIPDRHEQVRIREEVGLAFSKIDQAREVFDHQVSLLQERRQALITAAVTGQLDIPAAA